LILARKALRFVVQIAMSPASPRRSGRRFAEPAVLLPTQAAAAIGSQSRDRTDEQATSSPIATGDCIQLMTIRSLAR
jgi:hypothetical protein